MSKSKTTIPFSPLRFVDNPPTQHQIERRLKAHLRSMRAKKEEELTVEDDLEEEELVTYHCQLTNEDEDKIKRRAQLYRERLAATTGMSHLTKEDQHMLAPLRGGLPVTHLTTERKADEIAAVLHAEMPWMSPATEVVWYGLRASVREGLAGIRFNPLVLVGPPGIGKSYWARRLAHHLSVPTTKIEATGEPATFSLDRVVCGSGGRISPPWLRERIFRI